jgi:hypothetical protein
MITKVRCLQSVTPFTIVVINVADSDPNPYMSDPCPDPAVRAMDPDPELLSSSKNSRKNLDSYCFVTLSHFLSLKNNINVPSKSNMQKIFF